MKKIMRISNKNLIKLDYMTILEIFKIFFPYDMESFLGEKKQS